jgi:polyhydroxyalkanoate synthesis regulator phasin
MSTGPTTVTFGGEAMTDIKERLRDMASKKYSRDWSSWVQKQCNEAADRIEALEKEVRTLNAFLDEAYP